MDKSSINSKHFQQNKSILDDDCDNRSMKNPSQNYTNESQYNTENDLSDKFLPNSNFLSNYSKQERTNDFMKSSANLVSSRYSKQIVCGDKMNFRFEKDRCQDENEDELLLDTRRKLNRNESSFDSIGLKKKINLDININRSSDQEYSEIANDDEDEEEDDDEDQVLFTGYVPIALKYFTQQSKPRYWCLKMITSPWFERISMLIIIINCITLGMYQPCDDNPCTSTRCKILTQIDNFIFGFFAVEMVIKILAMGFYGKDTYMADSWNRLDFFIVLAGTFEYAVVSENLSLSAIRTVRVLRPLRAINRVPSMRILVMLLLDTLPMLGNVLLLCFFVFFIFGIIGVQLWKGVLRNRCFFDYNHTLMSAFLDESFKNTYYKPDHDESFICSQGSGGMTTCSDIPPFINNTRICNSTIDILSMSSNKSSHACINWNHYYSICRPSDKNPFQGAISFDNIGYAWVSIFQIISLESWVTIMYYIQDAHSFWNWIYFVFLIVIGSFFMINLCLVVIATQFSETKKRETERMIAERRRFSRSSSTLLSDSGGEPGTCWEELLKYTGHLFRKTKRRILRKYNQYKINRKRSSNEKTLKLNKKLTAKDDLSRILIKNNPDLNQVNLNCKCKCHLENNNHLKREISSSAHLNNEIYLFYHSGQNSDPNQSLDENCYIDSNSNMIPIKQMSPSIEKCSKCKHSKKFDIIHKKMLNLNDSAILSFSINSNNSKVLNRNASNEVKYFKEICSNLLLDNQEYFYCYSTVLTPETGNESNIGDNGCLNENHQPNKNKLGDDTDRRSRNKLRKAKQTKNQNCFLSCFCCCSSRFVNTKICIFLNMIDRKIKNFVDGNFFQRTILFSILINTFCMGIEHHQQPNSLTLIVEYSNIFFTIVFLIEMLLKIISNGPYGYIRNAFNLLDGIIVGISCYEVFKQLLSSDSGVQISPSGVSVLRTFRLLRILKLVRFMPALRRQLLVMLRTIDNVATFFSLLVLFIFIFSILGMNLFGCKFCVFEANGTRACERKNFDSLLWATITVFQILTQEDWNEVLYNGMEKTSSWAALYFIVLMTFGNYVLFNLLVAILVEGFSSEDEPKKAIEDRIIEDAMHAIAEEASRETHSAHSISRKNSKKKSRKNSKISITEEENSAKHSSQNATKHKLTGISTDDETKKFQTNLSMRENLNFNLNDAKRSNQLPIITQTCPTPTYSPSSSSQNSPLPTRFIFNPAIKSVRKFSLDSSSQRIKLEKLNKLNFLTNSTDSKIYAEKELRLKSARSDIAHLGQTKIESILKKNHLEKKNSSPKKIDFQLTEKNKFLKSRNRSTSKLIISSPQIILDFSNETDSIITNNSFQNENNHTTANFNRITRKRLSKSFHEKLGVNSSNLMVPKFVYKRPRSKSERIKTKTNKISDKNEPFNKDIVPLDQMANTQESSIVININNNKPAFIKKSDLFNIDINLSRSRSDIQLDSNFKEKPKKARLDFGLLSKISKSTECLKEKEEYSIYLFSPENYFRNLCTIFIQKKCFDYTVLFFIALNCITLAMERPNIPPNSIERKFLTNSNYCFTIIFALEMIIKVISTGLFVGKNAYFKSGWNKMDGILVLISLIDIVVTFSAKSSPKIFGILRVFRLLRTLRPLRVISRAPGLKLVVQTLLSSLRPIGNIVLICCTFFIIFGILGVQLFKGKLYHCQGPDISSVKEKSDCLANPNNEWVNSQYNFDNLGQALMTLFVLSSKDGWVQIMYSGIDAVAVDKQPIENYNEWMLLYFISFLLLVGFFVLNMFVGVIIENFHKCRAQQEREEKARRAAKRAKKFEIKRIKMKEIPYYANYSKMRRLLHDICNNKYFDLVIAGVIGLNVVSMSLEFYMMPKILEEILDFLNILFTLIFLLEAILRLVALGFYRYFREKWNQLDVLIVVLSIIGIVFDKLNAKSAIPINPTIIRVMRVLRIARVLKLLKMAKGIRSLLDTVIQALPQVGNLGLLFFLLFFIFAILGVELFGKLNCDDDRSECDGLSKHAHFHNFGMAFLTLFRIATGDNWNGIMKDALKDNILCRDESNNGPSSSMCLSSILAPIYFVIFVLMAQFVLVNVVVAVLMKHLDDSNKMMADDAEMDEEIEQQLEDEARNNIFNERDIKMEDDLDDLNYYRISKQNSLPPNFIFNLNTDNKSKLFLHSNEKKIDEVRKSLEASTVVTCGSDLGCSIEEETESIKLVLPSIKLKNLKNNKIEQIDGDFNSSSINLSDSNSDFIRQRKKNKFKKIYDDEVKSHFSPRSSVKIRIIDETDTDNNEIY